MNKRSVTKEKLCDWLETVCRILDQFSIPWLNIATPLAEEVQTLKDEKIADQKTIIDLQSNMIDKSEDQLKSVKSTAETELKSYSSLVSKTCAAALAPKKIHAAVKKVATQEERGRNVVTYGLPESQGEQLQNKVETVLIEIAEKPSIRDCCRVLELELRKRTQSDLLNSL